MEVPFLDFLLCDFVDLRECFFDLEEAPPFNDLDSFSLICSCSMNDLIIFLLTLSFANSLTLFSNFCGVELLIAMELSFLICSNISTGLLSSPSKSSCCSRSSLSIICFSLNISCSFSLYAVYAFKRLSLSPYLCENIILDLINCCFLMAFILGFFFLSSLKSVNIEFTIPSATISNATILLTLRLHL